MPSIVEWTTYGICSLLTSIWEQFKKHKTTKEPIPHYWIEVTAALERTLNYCHTGNAKVITKGLMDPLWLSLSLTHDGLPSISTMLVLNPITLKPLDIRMEEWPMKKGEPRISSERSQIINYGQEFFEVNYVPRRCAMGGFAETYQICFFRAIWPAL